MLMSSKDLQELEWSWSILKLLWSVQKGAWQGLAAE